MASQHSDLVNDASSLKKRRPEPIDIQTGNLKQQSYLNRKKPQPLSLQVGFDYSQLKNSEDLIVSIFGKDYKTFRVFDEKDVVSLGNFQELIEAQRDEDVDSDKEIIDCGKSYCFRDLLVVKQTLDKNDPNYFTQLQSYKAWAPFFRGGNIPRS